jgi:hypothetical protein
MMNKHDSWLQAGAHNSEDEEVYTENRVDELLKKECNPCAYDNLVESISEDCLIKHKEQIEDALQKRDFAVLGRLIWSDMYDYWEKSANNWAHDDWQQGFGE